MQSLMGETPKTALHRCQPCFARVGETPKTALHRFYFPHPLPPTPHTLFSF
ncbi:MULTISPECIES: hypothetical protein [unclassified Moorena]|uniref:hypothetical protein n=1 Tax=unclassified Moorena TaxID=2683338 RepID=UPI0014001A35|nr:MULTISPECIES: hypothetical protein [unclassified Moorena]NEO11493.1 hypothetical protein [Moorena sp. SIO3E8]NEP97953.1 hypothetical protein [Moorena sp. SIO3F7]